MFLPLTKCLQCFWCKNRVMIEISFLSLHDALPILADARVDREEEVLERCRQGVDDEVVLMFGPLGEVVLLCDSQEHLACRSEEHTSELQSRGHLVCRLLREKEKNESQHDSDMKHRQ